MILRPVTSLATFGLTLSLLPLLQPYCLVSAKKDEPRISRTSFENPLQNIFYFEDSDVIIGHERETSTAWRSTDAGESWDVINDDGQKKNAWDMWPHPWDKDKAYIIGPEHKHWQTKDRGKTWKSFKTQATPSFFREPLVFHGRDSKRVIFHGQACESIICEERAYYTDDDFETVEPLREDARGCLWAISTPMFAENSEVEGIINDRIFCIVRNLFSPWPQDNAFVSSDNFFIEEREVVMSSGRTVKGVISAAPAKGYIVAAATADRTDEMTLYVTHDATTWHKAEFGSHKVEQDAYTLLEGTNYSMQIDVMTTKPTSAMGVLFTSNSNGTYFTRNIEHTNRGPNGLVDFEKISGIQGIVLVNTVDNWKRVEETSLADKEVQSSISFDDGRTFQELKVGDDRLHLHSVSDLSNSGRVFSSPAPGLVMGIGNTGKYLKSYKDGDLFVSDDAGVTWRKGLDGPHKYEFGDQGSVLLAIEDSGETSTIQYSIDHGKKWKKADLEEKIVPRMLTTTPDSTSLKFLLLGSKGKEDAEKWYIFSIDFDGLHERKCGKDDFERWHARVDSDGKPSCLMGHKQFYRRRKPDADCFIDEEFKDPVPEFETCECTKADFECDYNFKRSEDREKCELAGDIPAPSGACKDPKDTFKGSSGWRLIPGNDCKRTGGEQLDEPVERSCGESGKAPAATGEITKKKNHFKSKDFSQYFYLERTERSEGADESIIVKTSTGEIFLTDDHGKNWNQILEDEKIDSILPHQYYNDVAFFLTTTNKVHYSIDRGKTFHSFETPDPPSEDIAPLAFHPDYKDWLIWTGAADCPGKDCHAVAHYTTDRGDDWKTLLRYVRKCEFIKDPEKGQDPEKHKKKLVYCEQHEKETTDGAMQLLSSTNWFADRETHFSNILGFAVMSEFIIVAAKSQDQESLKVDASIDGATFADAQFPPNFKVDHQQAYTVLDSSTHAVFLHVTVNNEEDHKHGTLIKSNSNGTSYTMSLGAVNQDRRGYVDFEKMLGLEGVAMVNIVSNVQKNDKGEDKELKTMITHNDGAEWALIAPPEKDTDGKKFGCSPKRGQATDKCALHLHSYTERDNKQATFGSASAMGLMMAVGNVGEFLLPKSHDSAHTFITRDGGISWTTVQKGNYMWGYGDQGSVVVIVKKDSPTKVVHYTLDEGQTWKDFEFSDVDMHIELLSTVPSDNSFNFLLWGREVDRAEFTTVNVDFSNLKERERKCDFDEENPVNEDYYFWSPKHPLQKDDCLFGHVAQYHRKKPEALCRNGAVIPQLHDYKQNCTCTRQDYECDYNFERMSDGSCQLVAGLETPDHSQICREDSTAIEYYEPTGYRRIPLTTCQGGNEYDKDYLRPCPNKLGEFKAKHGLSGIGLFFAIVIPIGLASGVGYWVWQQYQSGRLLGFGQIRLGETPPSFSFFGSGGDNPLLTIPITIIAGTWAVVQAVPLLTMSLWRSAKGYFPVSRDSAPYRSRAAFSSRRQDYSSVVADEDELLGDDFDEDPEA